jgi:DNA-binding NarL/FixJ family response regulator
MFGTEHFSAAHRHRVAVFAGDVLAHNGVVAILAKSPEFEVLPRNRETDADVAVVVGRGGDVVDELREISQRVPTRFVAVSRDHRTIDLLPAIELGLRSVVPLRDVTAAALRGAVLAVCAGGAYLPVDIQGSLLTQVIRVKRELLEPRGLRLHRLESREVDLLRLLAAGWELPEIADKLSYSERTVKNVLHSLTKRLGLRNRTQAVAYAIRNGAI